MDKREKPKSLSSFEKSFSTDGPSPGEMGPGGNFPGTPPSASGGSTSTPIGTPGGGGGGALSRIPQPPKSILKHRHRSASGDRLNLRRSEEDSENLEGGRRSSSRGPGGARDLEQEDDDVIGSPTSLGRKTSGSTIRRLRSLPAGTPRPRIVSEPRTSAESAPGGSYQPQPRSRSRLGSSGAGGPGGGGFAAGASPLLRSDSRSKIPKLSVSWWETNSVAGEAPTMPPEASSDAEDDASSICSHGSRGSSIMSQNWTGKSTRYVPHCAKRHMHKNDSPEDYLTPTQRKNRLIADLRKELRTAHKMLEDKDRHIGQLRDRLNEVETVLDQGGYLSENHRLMSKIGLIQEQHRKEKEALAAKYESRIRKLRKSVMMETDLSGEGFQNSLERGLIPPPPIPSGSSRELNDLDDDLAANSHPADPAIASTSADGKSGSVGHLESSPSGGGYDTLGSGSGSRKRSKVKHADAATETELDHALAITEQQLALAMGEIDRLNEESGALSQRVNTLEASDVRVHELEAGMTHHSVITQSTLGGASATGAGAGDSMSGGRETELIAQLEAYKAECIIWRTRASECELSAKKAGEDLLAKTGEFAGQLAGLEAIRDEYEKLQALSEQGDCPNPKCAECRERLDELEEVMTEFGASRRSSSLFPLKSMSVAKSVSIDVSEQPTPSDRGGAGGSFSAGKGAGGSGGTGGTASLETPKSPGRSRYATEMSAGIQQLNMEIELQARLMEAEKDTLKDKITELENGLAVKDEELDTCIAEINDLRKEVHNRKTAIEVAEITMERMREDNVRLREQKTELEGKIQNFESTGFMVDQGDSGVTASAPSLKKRSRYNVVEMVSRNLQTDLSSHDIEHAVGELGGVKLAYSELETKYALETEDYQLRLAQIADSLGVKDSLADTLNRQLQELQDSYEEARSRWGEERTIFTDKIAELAPVAQRVPFLEREVAEGQAEISRMSATHRQEKEEFERALEQSLSGAVSTHRDSEEYWKEKMRNVEHELESTKQKLDKADKELTNTKLRLNLEKAQLENELGERSTEIRTLHGELYREKVHVKIQTVDLGIDKAVDARAEIMDSETWINDGDLYDEKTESIKLLQGELAASRRQIAVLDEKLADFVAVAGSEKDEKVKNLLKIVSDHQKELENLKVEKITDISDKSSLEQKMEQLLKERDMLKRKGKENLERLEQEFQLVQKELQSVVNRYENEKHRLLAKLKAADDHIDMLRWKQGIMKQELRLVAGKTLSGGGDGKHGGGPNGGGVPVEIEKLEALLESAEATLASEFSKRKMGDLESQNGDDGDETLDEDRILADAAAYGISAGVQNAVADLDRDLSEFQDGTAGEDQNGVHSGAGAPIMSDSGISLKNPDSPMKTSRSSGFSPKHEPIPEKSRDAKICVLADEVIEENGTLRNDLEGLREKVDNLLREAKGKGYTGAQVSTASAPQAPVKEEAGTPSGKKAKKGKLKKIPGKPISASDSAIPSQKLEGSSEKGDENQKKSEDSISLGPGSTTGTALEDKSQTNDLDTALVPLASSSALSTPQSATFDERLEEIKEDLRIVLEDHGRMTAAASNVAKTAHASLSADVKFTKLEKWLQCDIQQEKLEMETVCQWYEKDKFKLADALKNARREILALNEERHSLKDILRDMQGQLQTLQELYAEVCREIHLYKIEDTSGSRPRSKSHPDDPESSSGGSENLRDAAEISKSESDVHHKARTEQDAKWKSQVGKIFKEKVLLEKKFRAVKYEKSEADQNVVMLRGELEVVKAAYETERDKLLAKISDLTGESWTDEASTNYVRELQQNVEIKKQELFDLSARYDRDVRQLQEDLYAERAKRDPPPDVESQLRSMSAKSGRSQSRLSNIDRSASNVSNVSEATTNASSSAGGSRVLLRRELEKDKQEILALRDELISERGQFETMVKELHGKLRISSAILSEKEQLEKIMEKEIASLQQELAVQNASALEDNNRLRAEIQALMQEKSNEILANSVVTESSPVSVVELEKSWKNELRTSQKRYEGDMRSLRRDLSMQHERYENSRREASKKLKACTNILTEKENCIKILERELRSAEDGLKAQKTTCSSHESQLGHLLTLNARLKALLSEHHIPLPPMSTSSLSLASGEYNIDGLGPAGGRPKVHKRGVRFADDLLAPSSLESISERPTKSLTTGSSPTSSPTTPLVSEREGSFESATDGHDPDLTSVQAALAEYRRSYENLKSDTSALSVQVANIPLPELERIESENLADPTKSKATFAAPHIHVEEADDELSDFMPTLDIPKGSPEHDARSPRRDVDISVSSPPADASRSSRSPVVVDPSSSHSIKQTTFPPKAEIDNLLSGGSSEQPPQNHSLDHLETTQAIVHQTSSGGFGAADGVIDLPGEARKPNLPGDYSHPDHPGVIESSDAEGEAGGLCSSISEDTISIDIPYHQGALSSFTDDEEDLSMTSSLAVTADESSMTSLIPHVPPASSTASGSTEFGSGEVFNVGSGSDAGDGYASSSVYASAPESTPGPASPQPGPNKNGFSSSGRHNRFSSSKDAVTEVGSGAAEAGDAGCSSPLQAHSPLPRVHHAVSAEEKAIRLMKELHMINSELEVTRDKFWEEKRKWIAENAQLKEQVQTAKDETATKLTAQEETTTELQSRMKDLNRQLEELRSEMDAKEAQHQQMYMVMFQKGQEVARAESQEGDVVPEYHTAHPPGEWNVKAMAARVARQLASESSDRSEVQSIISGSEEPDRDSVILPPPDELEEVRGHDRKGHGEFPHPADGESGRNGDGDGLGPGAGPSSRGGKSGPADVPPKSTAAPRAPNQLEGAGNEIDTTSTSGRAPTSASDVILDPAAAMSAADTVLASQRAADSASASKPTSSGVTQRAKTHVTSGSGGVRSTPGGHFRAQSGSSERLSKEEIMLRFLRDAMYYFMINRDPKDHLYAIMNILKFSEQQRSDVLKTKGL